MNKFHLPGPKYFSYLIFFVIIGTIAISLTKIRYNDPATNQASGWKTFTNTKYKYSINYPSNYIAKDPFGDSTNLQDKPSIRFYPENETFEGPTYPTFYIDVVYYTDPSTGNTTTIRFDSLSSIYTDSQIWNIPNGATTQLNTGDDSSSYILYRHPNKTINGHEVRIFEGYNLFMPAQTQIAFIKTDSALYVVGTHKEFTDDMDLILNSFKIQ